MIGAARGAIALGLILAVPAQLIAACCLIPRIDHVPAHAAPTSHAHAPTERSAHDPGADPAGHRAGEGLTSDRGEDRVPCILPAAAPTLREKAGASTSDGAVGGAPIPSVRPDFASTSPIEIAYHSFTPDRGSFRPLRL